MKKFFIVALIVLTCTGITSVYARGTANIDLKINDPKGDNRYFLCLPNIGCLSILQAEHGKIYPIIHSFKINNIYLENLHNSSLYYEGAPRSCQVKVNPNQTLNIYGTIDRGKNTARYIKNLSCRIG